MFKNILLIVMALVLAGSSVKNTFGDDAKDVANTNQQLDQIDQQVRRARVLLQTNDAGALSSLRTTATDSLQVLFSLDKNQDFLTSSTPTPAAGLIGHAAREAAEAHYWWGMAAQQFNSPDEAITAFARAAKLCPNDNDPFNLLNANITSALTHSLQNGFPQSAAPDVLNDIAAFAGNNHWTLQRTTGNQDTIFLWTQGNLAAPASMPQTAPLYRNIPDAQLPPELRSTQIIYAYTIPSSLFASGLATLRLRVRFTSPQNAAMAGHLAQIMLQSKLLNDDFLQRPPAPLTLWLETVASDWPNSPSANSPWEAAAKIDSAPNEIMVFRINEPRSEGEWMRELLHEYGHVAWPDFKVFAPPLEPNANGLLSETLGSLWLAANAGENVGIQKSLQQHVQTNALPALQNWLHEGPQSISAAGNNEAALHYLQGFCVYIDRVYGTEALSEMMQKLQHQNNSAQDMLHLFPQIIDQERNTPLLPIYLPAAAIDAPFDLSSLINKTPVTYASNTIVNFEIYIPTGTQQLSIPWTGSGQVINNSTFGGMMPGGGAQNLTISLNGISGWRKLSVKIEGEVTLGIVNFEEPRT